jgi:hypothetical protein
MTAKPIPNEGKIELLLNRIQPEPSERYYHRMTNTPWAQSSQTLRDKTRINPHFRFAITAALTVLVAFIILFATPQGRAWAQNTLRFFTRAESNTLPATPFPTAEMIMVDVTPGAFSTPEPTPTSNIQTLIPFFDACGGFDSPACTVEQIRSMVNFEVKELARIPAGMRLIGATGGPDGVTIHYRPDDMTGGIMLSQGPWTDDMADAWKVALTATVETAPIGNVTGEYVKGLWSSGSSYGTAPTWDPGVEIQTLRWRAGNMSYTMMVIGSVADQGQPLDKDGMAALAAELTTQPVAVSSNTTYLKTVQEVEALAGFVVVEPSQLPENFTFSRAAYSAVKNTVCLFYQYKDQYEDFAPPLTLIQSFTPLPGFRDLPDPMYKEMHIDPTTYLVTQTLTVDGAVGGQGVYLDGGGISIGSLCGVARMPYERGLIWQAAEGRYFAIFFQTDVGVGMGFLTKQEMMIVAKSLNEGATIPTDAIDPERLHSVQDAKALAGFDVKEPGKLPKGFTFNHAAYFQDGQIRNVTLDYIRHYEISEGGGSTGFTISASFNVTVTLDMMDNTSPGFYKKLWVNGQPALYMQGCGTEKGWDWNCSGTLTLTWFDNGVEYRIWAILGDLNEETAVAIAESMR